MNFGKGGTKHLPERPKRGPDRYLRLRHELRRHRSIATKRKLSAAPYDPIVAQCMALLDGDAFDAEALKELDTRESYPATVQTFRRVLRQRGSGAACDIVRTLVDGGPSLHFRVLQ